MNKKINFIPAIGIITLCAILVGTVVVLAVLQTKDAAKTSSFEEEVEDETADWKTYRNEKSGFEIKYPFNFNLTEAVGTAWDEDAVILHFEDPNWVPEIEDPQESFLGVLPSNIILRNDITEKIDRKPLSREEIIIDGRKGEKLEFKEVDFGSIFSYWKRNSGDKKMYTLQLHGLDYSPSYEEIYNQMLSTFRFIEEETKEEEEIANFEECVADGSVSLEFYPCQCATPDGKIFVQETETENVEDSVAKYTDEEFGFSFHYPKSWGLSFERIPPYAEADLYLTEVGPYDELIFINKHLGQRIELSSTKFGYLDYYYDEDKDQWMQERREGMMDGEGISPAEPQFYTISGLPVFTGFSGEIVAFSTDEFLTISFPWGSMLGRFTAPFTKTIIKTGQEIDDEKLRKVLIEEVCSMGIY